MLFKVNVYYHHHFINEKTVSDQRGAQATQLAGGEIRIQQRPKFEFVNIT